MTGKIRIVAIGASAGGLEACSAFLKTLPANTGMAFILIQHLEPSHDSLMVELLAKHTGLTVLQAADGMKIARNHFYVIPPAAYLTVRDGLLRVTPTPRRGARLPFDVLLQSLAEASGPLASCIVMSGTGTDGTEGARAIKRAGGLVIAQDPADAGYDGMPRSVIATGVVDHVLEVARMPAALAGHAGFDATPILKDVDSNDRLPGILALLRTRTSQDFSLYKPGTLRRRVERRMAIASLGKDEFGRYENLLNQDPAEIDRLAKDLLIHVTGFFRDPAVFEYLARTVVPDMIRGVGADHTLRIWVAGCSTGEEAYSIAILFQEQVAAAGGHVKLQIFASDADADAVASAREGLYPPTIETDISPARLAAFFTREEQNYRVAPSLRGMVVFTVQDLLSDPPFSRLDMVSCRNVMIYLGAEAQRKVVALFHFALRNNGILLLGNAESVGEAAGRFETLSKPARLFRQIGRSRPGDVDFARNAGDLLRVAANSPRPSLPSRQSELAELCRQQTLELHAPATLLATRGLAYLYSLGPTERYLRVSPGHATTDVLAMVSGDLRTRLRSAILRAISDNALVKASGGRTTYQGRQVAFDIEVKPVVHQGEPLLLIHFIDRPELVRDPPSATENASRVDELERELASARDELGGAVQSLEILGDEQKAINENALSVNEEFQSTNEELLTSKEELQSLNEELSALNSQLQETLEQQRTTADDLQNVLFSTDMATLCLDKALRIRFFTPATKSLFNVIRTDIGRPLSDLHSLAADVALSADATMVLRTLTPIEREIVTARRAWSRRILPYRTHDNAVEGVVITFTDITQRRQAAEALLASTQVAEQASAAKSHFLAAASHDLRQPLQTLVLLQGLLARRVAGTPAEALVTRMDNTVGAMSSMLNTLLDINQIEAGVVQARPAGFPINDMLADIGRGYAYQAQAKGLDLRIVPCGLEVHSDRQLLEQMIRNLVANAIKYTRAGRVLLGCRRDGSNVRIEVWDTGIGIPQAELKAIFEEYRQLDNAARERDRGLGLGLAIVQRLATLLGHAVDVRSRLNYGSVFSVTVPAALRGPGQAPAPVPTPAPTHPALNRVRVAGPASALPSVVSAPTKPGLELLDGEPPNRLDHGGRVLVVDDDPDLRELLTLILTDEGHRVTVAADGPEAVALVEQGALGVDLLLTDYNLPRGMDGLAVAAWARSRIADDLPVIMLTGDITTTALSAIAAQDCLQLAKPVRLAALASAIRGMLAGPAPTRPALAAAAGDRGVVFLVDDDHNIRSTVRSLLEDDGRRVLDFATSEAFLAAYKAGESEEGCLLIDALLPGMGGLELIEHLRAAGDPLPAVMITGDGDVPMAVHAMKAGAADFIEKPISAAELLASIDRAVERARDGQARLAWQVTANRQLARLTPRQRQIMDLVLAGHPSKNIAAKLNISQRTVENHRASIMKATGSRSLPALARLAVAAVTADGKMPDAKPS